MPGRVQEYWERRAAKEGASHTATTNDVYLRELEIRTCVDALRSAPGGPVSSVLDVGCGDGYSTLALARAMPGTRFVGVDYSSNMIAQARRALDEAALGDRVSFRVADATRLADDLPSGSFDAVTTMRCLINLETLEAQATAMGAIAAVLKPGGTLIAFENFMEGQDDLTRARERMGLPPIPVRWHNRFFTEAEFGTITAPHFEGLDFSDFASGYYYVTRVLYSAMCKANDQEPDYRHDIHRFGVELPPTGRFSPVRLATARRRAGQP